MSVGSALGEARARAGLSLEQVAEQTRIRRTLVANIEADDFHACGGDFYVRGHIRSIGHVLGIDPEPLVREYDDEHGLEQQEPTASGVLLAERTRDDTRRRPNWTAAMVAALALVLGFGGYAALTDGGDQGGGGLSAADRTDAPTGGSTGSGDDSADGDSTGDGTGADVDGTGGASATGPAGDAVAQVPDGNVVVTLVTDDGRSWVSATGRNGRVLFEGLLEPGSEKTVRDPAKVSLVLGNAGAVALNVNGEDLGVSGGEGDVQRLAFGPGPPDASGG